jgi:hypothetical protein
MFLLFLIPCDVPVASISRIEQPLAMFMHYRLRPGDRRELSQTSSRTLLVTQRDVRLQARRGARRNANRREADTSHYGGNRDIHRDLPLQGAEETR